MPSMEEAVKIRDVAARHAYVFDSGLSSPDFFDVEKRMASEEFGLLRKHVEKHADVIEVGCFTGLNLIGLAREGHTGLLEGVDFVKGAIEWLRNNGGKKIKSTWCEFPEYGLQASQFDTAILFDVLEHQRNAGQFLEGVAHVLRPGGTALILVPKGREYYDCGHVGFFPDAECLRNVLDYVFDVEECYELASCDKIFAVCRKRAE